MREYLAHLAYLNYADGLVSGIDRIAIGNKYLLHAHFSGFVNALFNAAHRSDFTTKANFARKARTDRNRQIRVGRKHSTYYPEIKCGIIYFHSTSNV